MKDRSWCSPAQPPRRTKLSIGPICFLAAVVFFLVLASQVPTSRVLASSSDAPAWMHALVNVSLPAHDEKTDAVKLYAERIVTVQSADKIKTHVRVAYKILRPAGRELG